MLYIVTPYPNGGGYSLHEIGLLTLDIRDPQGRPITTASITQPASQPEPTPIQAVQDAPGREILSEPTPRVPPAPENPPQVIFDHDTGFSFEKPKSQKELLTERGGQEPVRRLGPGRDLDKEPLRKKPRSGKVGKRKSKELSDDDLPHVRSSSRTEITNIITATPAQAAAASKFGKV